LLSLQIIYLPQITKIGKCLLKLQLIMSGCFSEAQYRYRLFKMKLVVCLAMPPSNVLPFHGNEKTMNLNSLILANIQASPYFKVQLYELKTYHQVIDEIYTRVSKQY